MRSSLTSKKKQTWLVNYSSGHKFNLNWYLIWTPKWLQGLGRLRRGCVSARVSLRNRLAQRRMPKALSKRIQHEISKHTSKRLYSVLQPIIRVTSDFLCAQYGVALAYSVRV